MTWDWTFSEHTVQLTVCFHYKRSWVATVASLTARLTNETQNVLDAYGCRVTESQAATCDPSEFGDPFKPWPSESYVSSANNT